MNEDRQSPFTTAGKFLFLATVALGCAGLYFVFTRILERLPSGSYPVFYLFGPVVIGAFLFFFGIAAFLRRRGIAVLVSEIEEVDGAKRARDEKSQKQKRA